MADICRYLKRGHCRYGTKCWYKHAKVNLVCSRFVENGKCQFGEACWFRHDPPPLIFHPPIDAWNFSPDQNPIVAAVKNVVKAELQSGKKEPISQASKKRKERNTLVKKLEAQVKELKDQVSKLKHQHFDSLQSASKRFEKLEKENQQMKKEMIEVKRKISSLGPKVKKLDENRLDQVINEFREGLTEVRMRAGAIHKPQSKLEQKINSVWYNNFIPFDRSRVSDEKIGKILKLVFPRDSKEKLAEKFKVVQQELGKRQLFDHPTLRKILLDQGEMKCAMVNFDSGCQSLDLSFVNFSYPHVQAMLAITFCHADYPWWRAIKLMDPEDVKSFFEHVMEESAIFGETESPLAKIVFECS